MIEQNSTRTYTFKTFLLALLICWTLLLPGCGGGGGGGGGEATAAPAQSEEAELVAEAFEIFQSSYYDPSRVHAPAAADNLESYVNSYKSPADIYTEYYDAAQMVYVNERLATIEETIVYSFGTVLYIAFDRFVSGTAERIIQKIENGINNGHDCLILDVRLNGGGYVGEAADLLEYFLGSQYPGALLGTLVTREFSSSRLLVDSYREKLFDSENMFVLTSGATASATEILVAGLVYYDEATQVGTTTFGKNRLVDFYTTSRGDGYRWTNGIVLHADGVDREGIGITPRYAFITTDPFGYLISKYADPLVSESWISADNLPRIYDRDDLRYREYMAALVEWRPPLFDSGPDGNWNEQQ